MKRVLLLDGRMLRSTRVGGARGVFEFQEFNGADEAKAYLREHATDPASMAELRRALAEEGIGGEVWRMSEPPAATPSDLTRSANGAEKMPTNPHPSNPASPIAFSMSPIIR